MCEKALIVRNLQHIERFLKETFNNLQWDIVAFNPGLKIGQILKKCRDC